jgi:hypothetical protein
LRRIGVTAAALVVALVFALSVRGGTGSDDPLVHSCDAADLRFLEKAGIHVTSFDAWAADFRAGTADPAEVAGEAELAAAEVAKIEPNDPSLALAQKYLDAMFSEYGQALELQADGKDAGDRMWRAWGLRNFSHDVLVEAQPKLASLGCDVGPIL